MERLHASGRYFRSSLLLAVLPFATLAVAVERVTWRAVGPGGGGAYVSSAIHPGNPNVVLLGSDVGGIYLSTDGGGSWRVRNEPLALPDGPAFVYYIPELVYHQANPAYVYAGLFRSTDGGQNWERPQRTAIGPFAITVDPTDPLVVYLGTTQGFVYKSTDAITTWGAHTLPVCPPTSPKPNGTPLVRSVVVNPNSSQNLLAATDCGLCESPDAGGSWSWVNTEGIPYGDLNKLALHAASGTLYLTINTSTAPTVPKDPTSWVGGVYRSQSGPEWGHRWIKKNGNDETNFLPNLGFESHTDADPDTPADGWIGKSIFDGMTTPPTNAVQDCTVAFAGNCSMKLPTATTTERAVVRTDFLPVAEGQRYKATVWAKSEHVDTSAQDITLFSRIFWYDEYHCRVCWSGPGNPCNSCTPSNHWVNLWTTTDLQFNLPSDPWRKFERVAIAPARARYAIVEHFVLDAQGTTWLDNSSLQVAHSLPEISGSNGPTSGFVFNNYAQIVVDPSDASIVYVGAARGFVDTHPFGEDVGGIWKTTDGGETWSHVTRKAYDDNVADGRADEYPGRAVYDVFTLAIGNSTPQYPSGNQVLYFGTGGFAYRTTDGGVSWVQVESEQRSATTWKARGDLNGVVLFQVATDYRRPERVYYGDADNFLQVSYDGGVSYDLQGYPTWRDLAGVTGDAATSILPDPDDADHIYCGVNAFETVVAGASDRSGVVEGRFNGSDWSWTGLANTSLPKGGGVDLAMDDSRTLYSAVYSKGVFRRADQPGALWESLIDDEAWLPRPSTWNVYRIRRDPGTGRIFVGMGNPFAACTDLSCSETIGDTGVWVTADQGSSWAKISSPAGTDTASCPGTTANMDNEPVTALLPVGSNTVFVGTWSVHKLGKGGLYRGRCTTEPCDTADKWKWCRVITQPQVTGVVVSPRHASVLYAFASQSRTANFVSGQQAGLYKSVDGGLTWPFVPNEGLMHLREVKLSAWGDDPLRTDEPLTLYAATGGSGLFEGTVVCGHPLEGFPDFDSDGTADCSDSDDDNDGDPDTTDCEPLNIAVHHGATEVCNGIDDNCVGGVDEGFDLDGDGTANCFDDDADGDGVKNTAGATYESKTATGETAPPQTIGTISPSENGFFNTRVEDGTYETITEKKVGGVSRLEHKWTVPLPTGASRVFILDASKSSSAEGDQFRFSFYNGSTFVDLVDVTQITTDQRSVIALPSTIPNPLTMRVVDTSQLSGGTLDTIKVDYLAITNGDCNDLNANVGPARSENTTAGNCGDGLDNDCDGFTDAQEAACQQTKLHVQSITMACKKAGNKNYAQATVLIRDQAGANGSGAVVSGQWSGAVSNPSSGTTGSGGTVILSSDRISSSGTFMFTVTGVTLAGATYDPTANVETSDQTPCP